MRKYAVKWLLSRTVTAIGLVVVTTAVGTLLPSDRNPDPEFTAYDSELLCTWERTRGVFRDVHVIFLSEELRNVQKRAIPRWLIEDVALESDTLVVVETGWPLRSAAYRYKYKDLMTNNRAIDGILVRQPRFELIQPVIPTRVKVPSLIGDVLFWLCGCLSVSLTGRWARRRLRDHKHKCRECGYDMSMTMNACPECGERYTR